MTKSESPNRRRAAVLDPSRITMREIADELGMRVVTLRRRIRPIGDAKARRMWATRLDLQRRPRGNSLPVYHARRERIATWGREIKGRDLPVID